MVPPEIPRRTVLVRISRLPEFTGPKTAVRPLATRPDSGHTHGGVPVESGTEHLGDYRASPGSEIFQCSIRRRCNDSDKTVGGSVWIRGDCITDRLRVYGRTTTKRRRGI